MSDQNVGVVDGGTGADAAGLSRRAVVAGALAGAAAAAAISAPLALASAVGDDKASVAQPGGAGGGRAGPKAAEPALPNGSGFYRVKVGSVEVACIADGGSAMPGSPFPPWGANGTKADVDAALDAELLPREGSSFFFNCALVRSGADVTLLDLGNGKSAGPGAGKLVAHLANLGVKPSDVTSVVFSHLHGDHFGGLLDDAGGLVFEKARYFINQRERDFWASAGAGDLKGQLPEAFKKSMLSGAGEVLAKLKGRLEVIDDKTGLGAGVSVVPAFGHTPGHQMLTVESGGESLAVVADLVHHVAISMRRPDLHVAFDVDPVQGAASRATWLAKLAADKTQVLAYHMPFPGFGHVRVEGKGYRWAPALWQW
jgi:glyoxylase-like metal-dependent hydrolase (beta-lactamase superfamily II)